jgi:LysM repeat protein
VVVVDSAQPSVAVVEPQPSVVVVDSAPQPTVVVVDPQPSVVVVDPAQPVVVPATPSSDDQCVWVVVKAGDTLGKIAAANGSSVKTIVAQNQIKNANVIMVGQKLCVPR